VITQKVIKVSAGSFTTDIFFVALRPKADYGLLIREILGHTQRLTTVRLTPLDEWSARRRDLYLTTNNTHKRETSTPGAEFEPTVSAGERSQIYALDGTAPVAGLLSTQSTKISLKLFYTQNI